MADDRTAPRLRFTAGEANGLLTLSYVIQNSAARPIFLFNRLYKTIDAKSGFAVDPNLCTVEVRDQAIHIAKKIFPVPPNMHVEKLNLPCVSEVAPGGEIAEQITLPTPLHQWHPYLTDDSDMRTVTFLPIVFEMGYFFAVPGSKELAVSVPTAIGNCLRFDPFPITSQLVVAAGPTRNAFGVLVSRAQLQR